MAQGFTIKVQPQDAAILLHFGAPIGFWHRDFRFFAVGPVVANKDMVGNGMACKSITFAPISPERH